jgi:hypothetical protein
MSAIESNNAIFGHNRVEFHVDRVKAIVIALSSILFGLVLAVPPSMHTASVASGSAVVSAFVALGGAVVLVAVGIYLLLRVAMWRGPAVVIDAFGIHDRRAGAVMTPWSTIQDLRFLDPHGHRTLPVTRRIADDHRYFFSALHHWKSGSRFRHAAHGADSD